MKQELNDTTMKALALQELAEKLNGKYWEKGDKKRVYLDRGHNTKKMKTATYVCQLDNGEFKVCCYIDCPSQDWNWIKSQQQQIIDSVQEDVDFITAEKVFVVFDEKENKYADCIGDLSDLEDAERYLTEIGAENFRLEECSGNSDFKVKTILND